MAHFGFSVFFALSLLAGAIALLRTAAQNLASIKQALDGSVTTKEASCDVQVRVFETAKLPRIAERLNVRFPTGLEPVLYVPRAAPFEARMPTIV